MVDRAVCDETRDSWIVFFERMKIEAGRDVAVEAAAGWWGLCALREAGQAPTIH